VWLHPGCRAGVELLQTQRAVVVVVGSGRTKHCGALDGNEGRLTERCDVEMHKDVANW